MDDAEDVDMDGEDNDEQEEEERTKVADGEAQIDGVTEQEISQSNSGETVPTGENAVPSAGDVEGETTNATSTGVVNGEQLPNGITPANGTEDARPLELEQSAAEVNGDVSMAETEPTQDLIPGTDAQPTNDGATNATFLTTPPQPDGSPAPVPVTEASTHSEIKLPDITDAPAEPNAQEQSAVPMELDVEQPLERPEDSSDALALPVASSVPMPLQSEDVEGAAQSTDDPRVETTQVEEVSVAANVADPAASAERSGSGVPTEPTAPLPSITEPDATPSAQTASKDPRELESSLPPVERSMTPSPSPERIQEFKAHEAAAEETTVVPGNLPSPSPQPEPSIIASPRPVPSNAVEGSVGGSHVADVQFGGGASGAAIGEVALEQTSHEPAGLEMGEVTMEGEADPGKSLGEGDPVGVNGEEEFEDEDMRRADDAEPLTREGEPEGDKMTDEVV
jgi:hypothetical protein